MIVPRNKWFHVSGSENPADIPTRKVNGSFSSLSNDLWFQGPKFLSSNELRYDGFCLSGGSVIKDNIIHEAKKPKFDMIFNETATHTKLLNLPAEDVSTLVSVPDTNISLSLIVDCRRYSSLHKLILVTGYVYRFINNVVHRVKGDNELVLLEETLSLEEYNRSLQLWVKEEQRLLITESNFPKLKSSLNLFKDHEGVFRLKGRFGNTELSYEVKHPAILRSDSNFAKLVVLESHERVLHHGVESTLSHVRRKFWLVKGRRLIKNTLKRCIVCKKCQGLTMKPARSPDLPDFRTSFTYSFKFTGLDFAGPLIVKYDKDCLKAYVLILTCATTRALHLELVPSMSTDSFLQAFKRFIARKGTPDMIIHDNFKTFKSYEVKSFMLQKGVEQRCILPFSPWRGGFYERLVRTVKTTLKKVLGKQLLSFEELRTLSCEVELIVNCRPLTYSNTEDPVEALTPSHLIYGRNISLNHVSDSSLIQCSNKDISKQFSRLKQIVEHF